MSQNIKMISARILRFFIFFSVYFLLTWPSLSFAQIQSTEPLGSSNEWRREGQLFTLHISRQNPLRIFVVGREEAKLDLSKMSLTVRRLSPYPGKVLATSRANNSFVISDPSPLTEGAELEISAKYQKQSEIFRLKLENGSP